MAAPSPVAPGGAPRRLLVGIGNPDRGDDGAGREVAARLVARKDCTLEVRASCGEATSLMSAWHGFDDVTLVDACRGAGEPGSVHRLAPSELERLPGLRHASTHSLGVAAALGLASALGTLPSRLVIYAIEGARFGDGRELSPEVDRAVEELVALVVQESKASRSA